MVKSTRHLAARLIMRPRDTDGLGKVSGGVILSQIDLAAAVVARSACQNMRINRMVTRAMDRVEFKKPVYVNDVLSCYGTVTRIGRTSVTVLVEVEADRFGQIIPVTEATAVFVALDDNGDPTPICGAKPSTPAGTNPKPAADSTEKPATDTEKLPEPAPAERVIALRKVMMPNETNGMGNIFGGLLMDYMDLAGAYTASRACKNKFISRCVNRLMDKIEFQQPVHVNDIITCYGTITKMGTTSVSVHVEVEADRKGEIVKVTQADIVFVAVNAKDQAVPISRNTSKIGKGRGGKTAGVSADSASCSCTPTSVKKTRSRKPH